VTTPSATHRSVAPRPRRGGRVLVAIALVVALVLPLAYLFSQVWTTTGDAQRFVTSERTGARYVEKLTTLLARLTAAQVAAVRGTAVDAEAVRSAVKEVDSLDPRGTDSLDLRERWGPLPGQIEIALRQKGRGQAAHRAYAGPIGLVHGLIGKVGDASEVVRDPELDGYHLMDTALVRVPDVLLDAGRLGALAFGATSAPNTRVAGPEPQIAVVQDRVARSTEAISLGLRTGTDGTSSDTLGNNLLKPLDELVAAVDGLVRSSTSLATGNKAAPAQVGTATNLVNETALALGNAVLGEFDALLEQRADDIAGQRRNAVIALVIAVVVAVVLPWFRRIPGRRRADRTTLSTPDIVDARDLLGPELVTSGSKSSTQGRQQG
jgi:hypothetical protein